MSPTAPARSERRLMRESSMACPPWIVFDPDDAPRMSVTGGALSSPRVPCYPFFMLSPSDVTFYREQGYLVVPDVLDASTLDTVRRELARILDGARAVTAHTDVYDLEPGHRADDPRVRRMKTPHRFFPVFERLMRHPRLVGDPDQRSSARRPAARLQDQSQVAALRLAGRVAPGLGVLPAHQRRPPRGRRHARRLHQRERTAPGGAEAHRGPMFDHHARRALLLRRHRSRRDPAEIARAVPLTGRAGSMSFHHVRLVHGSAQNVSTCRARCCSTNTAPPTRGRSWACPASPTSTAG